MNKDKLIPNVKEDPMVERVKKYVAHDMVIIIYFLYLYLLIDFLVSSLI